MHKTHLPLSTWLIAMYLIATSSKGISAKKLSEWLGLQYRTVWHLCHRIRVMMATETDLLQGIVELDETDVGGQTHTSNRTRKPAPLPFYEDDDDGDAEVSAPKPKRGKGRSTNKPMAFTAVEPGGMVGLAAGMSHRTPDIARYVDAWVDRETVISTDERPAYRAIGLRQAGPIRVNHSRGEYARTDEQTGLRAHCNTAESGYAVFKRAIIGVWHRISAKPRSRYLAEVKSRWNGRSRFALERFGAIVATGGVPLSVGSLAA
jgi:hypothetical protein